MPDVGIGAESAQQDIVAGAAVQVVGTDAAVQGVVASITEQEVLPNAAEDPVVAAATKCQIVAAEHEEYVVAVVAEGDVAGVGGAVGDGIAPHAAKGLVEIGKKHEPAFAIGKLGAGGGLVLGDKRPETGLTGRCIATRGAAGGQRVRGA